MKTASVQGAAKRAYGGRPSRLITVALPVLMALGALSLADTPAPKAQGNSVAKMICPVSTKNKQSQSLRDALASVSTGGSPDAVVVDGKPALHLAAMEQNHLAICWLLAKGANPQATDGEGKLFYEYLKPQDMAAMAKSLCEKRNMFSAASSRDWEAIIDRMNSEQMGNQFIPSRFIPYMLAFGVSGGMDVNMKTAKGAKWPVRKDTDITFVRLLLALGWQAESPTPAQQLLYAVLRNDVKAAKKLLKEHADLIPAEGYDLLVHAQSSTMIKALLAAGADIKAHPAESQLENPMTIDAIILGAGKTTVAALLKAGAGLPFEKNGGNSALHIISRDSNIGLEEMVAVFVKGGADVNSKNTLGNTPLHVAYSRSNRPMVEALLAAGADASLVNNAGETPEQTLGKWNRALTTPETHTTNPQKGSQPKK